MEFLFLHKSHYLLLAIFLHLLLDRGWGGPALEWLTCISEDRRL